MCDPDDPDGADGPDDSDGADTPDAGPDGNGTDGESDTDAVAPPPVPGDALAGWDRTEASVERLYGVEGADVRGHTHVYEDRDLRAAVREVTGGALDQSWRFFFATRLAFRPPLAPGVQPTMLLPIVRSEAVTSFVEDLRGRGVVDVERGRRERTRTESGERVRLRQVTGEVPIDAAADADGSDAVPVEGWVGVWHDGDILVAGGAYPRTSLARALGVTDDRLDAEPSAYREELLALLAGVG